MLPVIVYYLVINAAAFGLHSVGPQKSGGMHMLSALGRLTVIAGGTPGMLVAGVLKKRRPRDSGPQALVYPLIWLALHIAVFAALLDRAGGGAGGWLGALCQRQGLCLYAAIINAVTFAAFAVDKAKAALGRWRIREAALLSLALVGGALGGLAAMDLCRHKIRTPRFAWGVPVMLAVQFVVLAWLAI
ncbi:MAG: DUF1294 domain-containing protein [Clostridiales bacterium]|nr:DUF1294 domain-containing protein [Clostridiales bacterium]MDY2655630.1 DUF1294 domain-containing protein [Candidatus Limiplasma sp.]